MLFRSLLDLLGPYVKAAAQETATPERDGWVRCRIPIESPNHGVQELLRLHEEVELLGPPALRKLLPATLANMTRHHKAKRAAE